MAGLPRLGSLADTVERALCVRRGCARGERRVLAKLACGGEAHRQTRSGALVRAGTNPACRFRGGSFMTRRVLVCIEDTGVAHVVAARLQKDGVAAVVVDKPADLAEACK